MAGRNAPCILLAAFFFCAVPGILSQTHIQVDNVLVTAITGLPLIEQTTNDLSVTVAVATASVLDPNGVNDAQETCSTTWQYDFSLASGEITNPQNLDVVHTSYTSTGEELTLGDLFFQAFSDVSFILERSCDQASILCITFDSTDPSRCNVTGTNTGCIPLTCRGVVITYIQPALLDATTLKQGEDNTGIRLTVSFESDQNYASVAGTDLWDPYVFGNGNQFGTGDVKVNGSNLDASGVSNYGIQAGFTSSWPELQVDIDLSSNGCPESQYICVHPQRNATSTVDFTVNFTPMSAQYGCVLVDCEGVVFNDGTLATASTFAEFKTDHEITISTLEFVSDATKGGVSGSDLWQVKVYASAMDDTGNTDPSLANAIAEQSATIPEISRDMNIAAGNTLSISSDITATLDLSSFSCSDLVYLCAYAERDPASVPNFEVTRYTVCQQLECVGLVVEDFTVEQTSGVSGNFPVRELVSFAPADGQLVRLDITLTADAAGGSVTGTDLWSITAFLSNTSDCSDQVGMVATVPATLFMNQDVTAGDSANFPDLDAYVNMTSLTCNAAPYICVQIDLTDSAATMFQNISGMTLGSLEYQCVGVQIDSASVDIKTPSPIEITERLETSFEVDLTALANQDAGNAIGDDLWIANLYLSPDSDGATVLSAIAAADIGDWQNTDVEAGGSATLADITAKINLTESCDLMKYLCVDLRKNDAASQDFTFDLDNNVHVACAAIDICHGVEIAETTLATTDGNMLCLVENSNEFTNFEVDLTGQATDTSANISGTNLWQVELFLSSDGTSMDTELPQPMLSQLQVETAIMNGQPFDFTDQPQEVINANFSMDDVTCGETAYLCMDIQLGDNPDPAFALSGNTTGCMPVTCKGVIVTDTELAITAIPKGALVEGFPNQQVSIQLDVTSNSSGADAAGDELWQLYVYTRNGTNGTGSYNVIEQYATTGGWIDDDLTAGNTLQFDVDLFIDMSSLLCDGVDYLCVEIQRGASPSKNFTLMYQTSPEDLYDCVPIVCETAGINNNGMSFSPFRIVELQDTPEPFTVSVSYTSNPDRDNITGTDLWSLKAFFSDSETDTDPAAWTPVPLAGLADEPLYSGSVLNFTGVTVDMPLDDFVCFENTTYFCTLLDKGVSPSTVFTLEILPQCQPINCTGVVLTSVGVQINSGEPLFEFIDDDQPFRLDVTLNTSPDGASVSGDNLWDFNVFLSNSDSVFDDPQAAVSSQLYTPIGHSLDAGTPLTVMTVSGDLNLGEVGCVNFRYLCVRVGVWVNASQDFNIDPQTPNADIGCAPIDCRGVWITSGFLTIGEGEPLVERVLSHPIAFIANLTFHETSTDIYGNDLWQAEVFTNTRRDAQGDVCVSASSPVVLDGNVTRGMSVQMTQGNTSLDITNCTCSLMPYLCVTISKNPSAIPNFTLEVPERGYTACEEIDCNGVLIDSVDLNVTSERIIYEVDTQSIMATVTLAVNTQSTEFEDDEIDNVWALTLFPSSNLDFDVSDNDNEGVLTEVQMNLGAKRSATVDFVNIEVDFPLYGFVCPPNENYVERLCVRASAHVDINPQVTVEFINDTSCVDVECRGVIFDEDELAVSAMEMPGFVEYETMHQITFNVSATVDDTSTNITNGLDLWTVLVYGSMNDTGEGQRYSETDILLSGDSDVRRGELVAFNDLTWELDLTNFTCPESNDFFMCVVLMPGPNPTPLFSMRPTTGLRGCTPIDCTGVVVELELDVHNGDPVLERNLNGAVVTVTANSQPWGSSIAGDDLWSMKILVCLEDGCSSAPIDEVGAPLSASQVDQDLPAGQTISFDTLAVVLDLTNYEACPEDETLYLCARLEKGNASTPDFKLQDYQDSESYPIACEAISCRGVHIAVSSASRDSGSLQEGNPDNPVTLDLSFTADAVSAEISGENLWEVAIFGSGNGDGTGERVGLDLGVIDSQEDVSLGPGGILDFLDTPASLNLSVYKTCLQAEYVCAELRRKNDSLRVFSVTGNKIACTQLDCTGVLVAGTTLEIIGDDYVVEGEADNALILRVNMTIDDGSSTLINVTDAWRVEVFGNTLGDGLGSGTGRNVADTSQVGMIGAEPGNFTVLEPVSVAFNMMNESCLKVNFICVQVYGGADRFPEFSFDTLPPDNLPPRIACAQVECRGVRISNRSILVTDGNPVLQGDSSFSVELDADFTSHRSGAGVSGTGNFGLQVFLARSENGSNPIGSPEEAVLPSGTTDTTLVAGQALNINSATATISTESLICDTEPLYLCAQLFRPETASTSYRLTGYDADAMLDDATFLIACQEVECRDVKFDDIILTLVPSSPDSVLERTAGQILTANLTVSPNSSWSSVSGTNLWMMTTFVRSDGEELFSEAITLSQENLDRGVTAGEPATFYDVELMLDLADFYCPSENVTLVVRIEPHPDANFSLCDCSVTEAVLEDVPCSVTNIVDSELVVYFPVNIVEYEENDFRFDVRLTADDVSAAAEGDDLWQIVRVFMSDASDGSSIVVEDVRDDFLKANQDAVGISAGETATLGNIEATLDLLNIGCYSVPFLCVEIARGDNPVPPFNVTFDNGANIVCNNVSDICRGIVITSSNVTADGNVDERDEATVVMLDLTIEHDPTLGNTPGRNITDPWNVTVFYNSQSDCLGDTLGAEDTKSYNDTLVNGQPLILEDQVFTLNLGALICPAEYVYLCVEFERFSEEFDVRYEPESTRFASLQTRCHGVEVSSSTFEVTSGARHEQHAADHDIVFSFTAQTTPDSVPVTGTDLWSFVLFGSRNLDGSGDEAIVLTPSLVDMIEMTWGEASTTMTFASEVTRTLDFNDVDCVDMPYLCLRLARANEEFSLQGVPDASSLVSCWELDCIGVYIVDFNASVEAPVTVYENENNALNNVNLSLSSRPDKENATGENLWQIFAFFNSDPNGLDEERIAETEITPLPNDQADQDFLAGDQISFGPLNAAIDLSGTCDDVEYLCFELRPAMGAIVNQQTVLLGKTISCVEVECRGVLIEQTELAITQGLSFDEAEAHTFTATTTLRPHPDSADISGQDLWSLEFYFSDSETGDVAFERAQPITRENLLSVNSPTEFTDLSVAFDDDVLCYQATHLCVRVSKNVNANPDFGLSGSPNDSSLIACAEVDCIGVVVESSSLNAYTGGDIDENPVLISGDPTFVLENTFLVTFATETREITDGDDLFNVRYFVTDVVGSSNIPSMEIVVYETSFDVVPGQQTVFPDTAPLNLEGVLCEEMRYVCAMLVKGPTPGPDFTLQGLNGDLNLLSCEELECRGVQIDDMGITFNDGVPLLEDADEHEVDFTLTISSDPDGANAVGDDLWDLTAFLSRDENGNDPISVATAVIGDAADTDLPAGGVIELDAVVTLNASGLVCDTLMFLCVRLDKGSAVVPDFTLGGVGEFVDVQQICQPFACQGINLTNPALTIGSDVVLREFNLESEVEVDVSIDVTSDSASVSGTNLLLFEFFTSSVSDGSVATSPRTIVDNLNPDGGLVAGGTASVEDLSVTLNLRNVSCEDEMYLCVEVWKGSLATPFYSINNPASRAELRVCERVSCVGVQLLEVTPILRVPDILIEDKLNTGVALDIILETNSSRAGIEGDNLFMVTIFGATTADGTLGPLGEATATVPNDQSSNRVLDRFNGTTLTNVLVDLDFTGRSCSELNYICARVSRGPNANPPFSLLGKSDNDVMIVGCADYRCAGVVITDVTSNPTTNEILEGDAAHSFTIDVVADTADGITTPGTDAWDLEVFVSTEADGSNPVATVNVPSLTAAAAPNSQITFSDVEAVLDLSGIDCAEEHFLCVNLRARPSANFTLVGENTVDDLLGCLEEPLECSAMNGPIAVVGKTDTTLTVSWPPSIGDFDTYRVSINPGTEMEPLLKSQSPLEHTFDGLTPGQTYTVTLDLLDGGMNKGSLTSSPITLLPACPDVTLPSVTSREITLAWTRPAGYETVDFYEFSISPSTGVTPSSPYPVPNPFTMDVSEFSFTFTTLSPASVYTISFFAQGIDGQINEGCEDIQETTDPGDVASPQIVFFNTTSVSLRWEIALNPSGFRLTISPTREPNPVFIGGSEREYNVDGLEPGTEYTFLLEAYVDVSGSFTYGDGGSVVQRTVPVAPDVTIDVTETQATVTYDAPDGFYDSFTHYLYDSDGVRLSGPLTLRDLVIPFSNLLPASRYRHTVFTTAGGQTSAVETTEFYTRPDPPREPITSVEVTTSSITIQWTDSLGTRDYYEVTYTPTDPAYSPPSPAIVSTRTFTLSGVDPYTTIDFNVTSSFGGVRSAPVTWRQRTFPTRPDPVQNLELTSSSPNAVTVVFNPPDRPNGLISGYLIIFNGQKDLETTSGNVLFTDIHPNDVRIEVPVTSLQPGYDYLFTVQAVNDEGTSDAISATITLQPGDPLPTGNVVATPSVTATTITIVVDQNHFTDDNGDIKFFQVFVVQEGITNRTISVPPLRYQQVVNTPPRKPYVTSNPFSPVAFSGRRKRQIANTQTTFVIGTEDPCGSDDEICNGPLVPLTTYWVLVRAFTHGGFADSPWTGPLTTRPLDSWYLIPIIIYVVIILFVFLVMLACCCMAGRHRRKKVKSAGGPRRKRGFEDSRINDNFNNSSHKPHAPPTVLSRPILTAHFHQHYNKMVSDKQHLFTKEFDDLRNIGQNLSKSDGKAPDNQRKNRYGNILPYNDTRVKLSSQDNYINANYMTGFNGSKEYIATQGPMSHTANDFWRMVWEKRVPAIVMLVRCIEGGKEKCDKYWPSGSDPTVFGSVIVTKMSENTLGNWVVRDFRLKVGTEEHKVRHFHYTTWPTHGSPRSTGAILNFIHSVRQDLKTLPKGPAVVHCGAGIGRTGVFIALDILMQEMSADQRTVDAFAVVARMRRERCTMVQSLVQYIFLHRALADMISGKGPMAEVCSIERSDAGSINSDSIEDMTHTSL